MSIIYCLIARNSDEILSEYTECTGNFFQLFRVILQKCLDNENKSVIIYDSYKIHILYEKSYYFLSLSDDLNDSKVFKCLETIKDEVFKNISLDELNKLKSYQYIQGNSIIEENIKNFNNIKDDDLSESSTNYIVKNINDILDSGLKSEIIVNKSKSVSEDEFLQSSKNISKISDSFMKEETSRKNKYVTFAGILVGILIIIFIIIE